MATASPDTIEGGATGADTDGDDIDDAFDADTLGGSDADHDGVDDAAVLPDPDGDRTRTCAISIPTAMASLTAPKARSIPDDGVRIYATWSRTTTASRCEREWPGRRRCNGWRCRSTPYDRAEYGRRRQTAATSIECRWHERIVSGGFGSLDANSDGRIDSSTDTDGDGMQTCAMATAGARQRRRCGQRRRARHAGSSTSTTTAFRTISTATTMRRRRPPELR